MAYNKFSNDKTTISGDGSDTVVYHTTQIVRGNSERIILRSGSWQSVTTRRKMNQASHQLFGGCYSVFQKAFAWYVTLPDGRTVDFADGMVIERKPAPSIVPSEAQLEYDRDLVLRVRDRQIGSGMSYK